MSASKEKYSSVHYQSYLQLEKILDAQHLRSTEMGNPAHEEMLFIIVHQVYELWFKQIIHELHSILSMFEDDLVDEREISVIVTRMDRIISIQKLLIQQIGIMESMTPLDFLDFRNYLFPASGFQSFQFRIIEILLGLRTEERLKYNNASFNIVFTDERRAYLEKIESQRSLLQFIEEWLERTPFLEMDNFNFLELYKQSVDQMLEREKEAINAAKELSPESKKKRLKMLGSTTTYFNSVFDPAKHAELQKSGQLKMSYRATIAALLIHLYRDEPILQLPYQFLARVMDIEENFTSWRYRHAQMVLRMIGRKTGTGGSSGHAYLHETAKRHQIFSDLYNISTLLIPRSELPVLPDDIRQQLGFYFSTQSRS